MIGEARHSPGGGALTVPQIERELARLRMDERGGPGLRASVLNLIAVADEEAAARVTRTVSRLADLYPSRAIILICDPEGEESMDVRLSAFCGLRGASRGSICAEQIIIHAQGPPASHLESLAGPLLIPDLPVFLLYTGDFSASSPEFTRIARLAGRVIVDSSSWGNCGRAFEEIEGLLRRSGMPPAGDLQWATLSPWRTLAAEMFASPERAGELERLRRVEVLYAPDGECRALLLGGWLASVLGWRPESVALQGGEREIRFAGPSGAVSFRMSPSSPRARLSRVRLYSDEYTFQISRRPELTDARITVARGGEVIGESTAHIGRFDMSVMLAEELRYRGHDNAYEAALRKAVEILNS